jgi:hypothetical protein
MKLEELVGQIAGFEKLPPREKIRVFGWYLHVHKNMEHFGSDHIRACFKELHLVPGDVGKYVVRMATMNTPDLLRERPGFKLARSIRTQLDAKYGSHPSVQVVSKLLTDLPGMVPDIAERVFLSEAIDCYRVRAFRACIVMTWNLAFDHVLRWILNDAARLAAFNLAIPKRYPKRSAIAIKQYDDFADEFKESEVIEVCNVAQLINGNIIKILKEKLVKRNLAAHPSSVVVVQAQADDVVTDLVNNVVLALP